MSFCRHQELSSRFNECGLWVSIRIIMIQLLLSQTQLSSNSLLPRPVTSLGQLLLRVNIKLKWYQIKMIIELLTLNFVNLSLYRNPLFWEDTLYKACFGFLYLRDWTKNRDSQFVNRSLIIELMKKDQENISLPWEEQSRCPPLFWPPPHSWCAGAGWLALTHL